ncbi:MAG TPA: S8 family serine peptidase [Cytophagales bacterium]|nr:S8 family serine peptidase [Cytophagales bacterium]
MGRNKSLISFIFILSFFSFLPVDAQRYFIYLEDKNGSEYSLERPHDFLTEKAIQRRLKQNIAVTERDLPVSTNYIDQIKSEGGKVVFKSRWLNGVLVEASEEVYAKIKALPFVKEDQDLSFKRKRVASKGKSSLKSYKSFEEDYGTSLLQNQMLGIDAMHEDGYYGEGITIAVLDAGFYKANEFSLFDSLFKNGRVVATYDFVNREKEVFEDDSHGMQVLSVMSGYTSGGLIGGAYKSDYVLLKTEEVGTETREEEIFWLAGAEFADSLGADILTSSLGYNTFDNPDDNYTYADLDGNTALITKAADHAASVGMLVVVSVGNEGNDSWGTLTLPADGDSVLAVGAVNDKGEYATFSSRGNTADNRIKPEVVALGVGTVVGNSFGGISKNNGTSFSSPLIAALAAGLWEAFPDLTNMELMELIKKSGNNAQSPDSLFGYGIPNYLAAKKLQINGIEDIVKGETLVFPNPLDESFLIVKDSNFNDSEIVKVNIYSSNLKLFRNSLLMVKNKQIILSESFLNSLIPGTYFIRIESKNETIFRKIIKQ